MQQQVQKTERRNKLEDFLKKNQFELKPAVLLEKKQQEPYQQQEKKSTTEDRIKKFFKKKSLFFGGLVGGASIFGGSMALTERLVGLEDGKVCLSLIPMAAVLVPLLLKSNVNSYII